MLPADSRIKVLEFANHVSTAIDSKQKTDQYLNNILNSSATDQIEDLFGAWSQWQTDTNDLQAKLRYYTLFYVLVVLALMGMLIARLRNLYANLDRKVAENEQKAKTAYQELNESERQLVQSEKMASLGQLVAGVAHEINTPLGYITSNLETIKARLDRLNPVLDYANGISATLADPNREKNAINKLLKKQIIAVRNSGKNNTPENLNMLINDASSGLGDIKDIVTSLTSYSHVQDAPSQDVDVHESIDGALKISAGNIGERRIDTQFDSTIPAVKGVPGQLVQIFTNIISNAIHAVDEETGAIIIRTESVDDFVCISFIDNGSGIDDESLKRVFDPFFTTKEVGAGTGLGLSIANRIVEDHQGELTITSKPNLGTTVKVKLPVSK